MPKPILLFLLQDFRGEGWLHYQDFSNTNPLEFNGVKYPIISMRWIYDVEGCFFTWSCLEDLKVKFTLNLLHLGAKNWWKLVTGAFYHVENTIVTWEKLTKMFCTDYVLLAERERLAQEYLSLKKTTDSATKITKMFSDIALFYPEYVASEQVQMSR